MKVVRYVGALLLVALAGCGGGGGGGGGGGANDELSIGALTPDTVTATFSNMTVYEGGAPKQVAVTASFRGSATGVIFVVIEDPDALVRSGEVQITSDSTATLVMNVDDSAPIGLYEKPMVLHVCRDAACADEFDGSPRTINKHIAIQGTTVSTSALSFASTVGMGAASQTVAVNAPNGADFDFDYATDPYVELTEPDGSTNLLPISTVFTITKTSGGLAVRPAGTWAGHYKGRFYVTTPGYSKVAVDLDYQVDAAATPVVRPLTSSVSGSAQAGSTDDIPVYVEYVRVMANDFDGLTSISTNATGGSPEPNSSFWLRYYDQTTFTDGAGPTGNATRMRFFLNPCFFGSDCLAPGTYTADIEISVSAFGSESIVTVPVTFTVKP